MRVTFLHVDEKKVNILFILEIKNVNFVLIREGRKFVQFIKIVQLFLYNIILFICFLYPYFLLRPRQSILRKLTKQKESYSDLLVIKESQNGSCK
jgi:hypothetical protein